MPAMNFITHFTSMKDQMVNLFKALSEILSKFLAMLIAIITSIYSDTGKSVFMEHHKLMICLILAIVLYYFLVIIGTILQHYNIELHIITCTMVVMGSVVSVLALSIISPTIAWIILALWVGMFIIVAYDCAVFGRIKNWIKGPIAGSSGLLPQQGENHC